MAVHGFAKGVTARGIPRQKSASAWRASAGTPSKDRNCAWRAGVRLRTTLVKKRAKQWGLGWLGCIAVSIGCGGSAHEIGGGDGGLGTAHGGGGGQCTDSCAGTSGMPMPTGDGGMPGMMPGAGMGSDAMAGPMMQDGSMAGPMMQDGSMGGPMMQDGSMGGPMMQDGSMGGPGAHDM